MPEYLSTAELHQLTGYVLRPDAEAHKPGRHYPGGGIYMLFAKGGRLLYIGQSDDIGYRVVQHHWASRRGSRARFAAFTSLGVPQELTSRVECAHIHALQPPENTLPRPSWGRHGRMVALIKETWESAPAAYPGRFFLSGRTSL